MPTKLQHELADSTGAERLDGKVIEGEFNVPERPDGEFVKGDFDLPGGERFLTGDSLRRFINGRLSPPAVLDFEGLRVTA
ncbi:unnamed protein product [Fusarium venenatum]|uniref:Uncharacterized protein n=1 Tax=Fusarium venenatum TaxID=56646 RepID=A0A2L2SU06_9HYPO|nr:uncharacterized protein FVRRES_13801 [Fusarium venenatum]CEI41912.1 unnamed protein product [Fusarium venenatum]